MPGRLKPRNSSWITKVHASSRSLSKIRRIYCGCAGFGQIFRSFSLNRPNYSPQTIETSDSNQHPLATIPNLGQAPRRTWQNTKMSHHHQVELDFLYFTMHTNILRLWLTALSTNSSIGIKSLRMAGRLKPRNSSWITKVHASSWRTWQNTKMSHHHQGELDFLYFTMHTNILRVFFAPSCRF